MLNFILELGIAFLIGALVSPIFFPDYCQFVSSPEDEHHED